MTWTWLAIPCSMLLASACSRERLGTCGDPHDALAEKLVDAASAGDEPEVAKLLTQGASARYVDGRKTPVLKLQTCPTALLRAAAKGHCPIVRRLLQASPRIEHQGLGGWTALHSAVQSGKTDCVRAMLEAGAAPNIRSDLGYTALSEAVIGGNEDIVELLLAAGADPNIKDAKGRSARDIARERGAPGIRRRIAEH